MTPGLIERLEAAGEHTPGPWTVVETPIQSIIKNDGRKITIGRCTWHAFSRADFPLVNEARANARLFAASPELLEALQWSLREIDGLNHYASHQQQENCRTKAEAAILKARATQEQG